jgi:hypothetical protein
LFPRAALDTPHPLALLRARPERPRHHGRAEQRVEVAPFQTEASRASDRKNSIPLRRQETAALRNFDPIYVGFGSSSTELAEATRVFMSAVPPNTDRKFNASVPVALCH